MVTSKGAGLTVPDWPNSYGYNMFTFPVSRWVGGIFFEHTHRLLASFVGLWTVGLAVWLARTETRRWVRTLGYLAVFAVVLQGVLGGLRVVLVADWIGIFHAALAQAFLALATFLAFTQTRWWIDQVGDAADALRWSQVGGLARHSLAVTLVVYLQMALGAAMRHAHHGLSIPDFPLAYGHWWPQIHRVNLPAVNQWREQVLHWPPTSLAEIHLQMTHRLLALVIAAGVFATAVGAWRRRRTLPTAILRLSFAWPVLIIAQIGLGMSVIWTRKAADVATAHVAVGALSFVVGVLIYSALRHWSHSTLVPIDRPLAEPSLPSRPQVEHALS